jgi:hypothetical protein
MNLKEYQAWQKKNNAKVYSAQKVSRWRNQIKLAIEQVIDSKPEDLAVAINNSYPFAKKEPTRYLIWLQERRYALERLNLHRF